MLSVQEHGLRSIAFCCLGTGIFGFPRVRGSQLALSAAREWLEQHADSIDRLVICTFDETDYEVYLGLAPHYFPLVADESTAETEFDPAVIVLEPSPSNGNESEIVIAGESSTDGAQEAVKSGMHHEVSARPQVSLVGVAEPATIASQTDPPEEQADPAGTAQLAAKSPAAKAPATKPKQLSSAPRASGIGSRPLSPAAKAPGTKPRQPSPPSRVSGSSPKPTASGPKAIGTTRHGSPRPEPGTFPPKAHGASESGSLIPPLATSPEGVGTLTLTAEPVQADARSTLRVLHVCGLGANFSGAKPSYLQRHFVHVCLPDMPRHSDHAACKQALATASASFNPDVVMGHSAGTGKVLTLVRDGGWHGPVVLLAGGAGCAAIAAVAATNQAFTVIIPEKDAGAKDQRRAVRACQNRGLAGVVGVEVNDGHDLNTTMVDNDLLRGVIADTVERHRRLAASKTLDEASVGGEVLVQ